MGNWRDLLDPDEMGNWRELLNPDDEEELVSLSGEFQEGDNADPMNGAIRECEEDIAIALALSISSEVACLKDEEVLQLALEQSKQDTQMTDEGFLTLGIAQSQQSAWTLGSGGKSSVCERNLGRDDDASSIEFSDGDLLCVDGFTRNLLEDTNDWEVVSDDVSSPGLPVGKGSFRDVLLSKPMQPVAAPDSLSPKQHLPIHKCAKRLQPIHERSQECHLSEFDDFFIMEGYKESKGGLVGAGVRCRAPRGYRPKVVS